MTTVQRTSENLGKRMYLGELKEGDDVIVCRVNPTYRQQVRNTCDAGFVRNIYSIFENNRDYIVLELGYSPDGKRIETTNIYFKVEAVEDNEIIVDESEYLIYRQKYGPSISAVVDKGKLPAGVDIKLAELLTGKRPKGFLPPKIKAVEGQAQKAVGGRTRRAKGRKYRKQAGRLSTRQARSSSR